MHAFDPCVETNEETIAKYAVDANLFPLGSTNPKRIIQPLFFFAFIPGAHCRGAFDLEPSISCLPLCDSYGNF